MSDFSEPRDRCGEATGTMSVFPPLNCLDALQWFLIIIVSLSLQLFKFLHRSGFISVCRVVEI